jgi:hypothetical protein
MENEWSLFACFIPYITVTTWIPLQCESCVLLPWIPLHLKRNISVRFLSFPPLKIWNGSGVFSSSRGFRVKCLVKKIAWEHANIRDNSVLLYFILGTESKFGGLFRPAFTLVLNLRYTVSVLVSRRIPQCPPIRCSQKLPAHQISLHNERPI